MKIKYYSLQKNVNYLEALWTSQQQFLSIHLHYILGMEDNSAF